MSLKNEINHLMRKLANGEEYKDYFEGKMDEHGVDSPDELEDEKKDDFFESVDSGWKADEETD